MSDGLRFRPAVPADAGEILTLQRAAFLREAQRYDDPNLPPLTESLESVQEAIGSAIVIVGCVGRRIVATGRVTVKAGVGHVGRLAVAPDLQGRGIGRRLLAELERRCGPEVVSFELFTGGRTDANLHLYRSAGYRDVRVEDVSPTATLVHLAKGRHAGEGDMGDLGLGPTTDDLVGSWRLERWESEADDGTTSRPFGEHPEGILVYEADGTMITTIAPSGRPRLSSADPLRGGPDDERRGAAETFVAYAGTWAMSGTDVVHTVAMSLYPNWVGTRQVRHAAVDQEGARLELSTDPFLFDGRRTVQRLVWRRGP